MADSKLDTPENLVAAKSTSGQFLCAGAFTRPLQARYREVRSKLQRIDYCSQADSRRPPEARDQYEACEVEDDVEGVFEGRRVTVGYRLIFIRSSAKAQKQAATRERHVQKIRDEFEHVQKNLGKYSLKTEEAIRQRLQKACGMYNEGKLFSYTLTKPRGQYRLTWQIDEVALQRQIELEGAFVLKTNLPKKQYPLAKVLAAYRGQSRVENRIHYIKGPLAVTPMFLENPKRIAGMMVILLWSLTVLTLMERQVRKNLDGKPMYGIYPENRPSPAPTGPKLLNAFETLCIVIIHDGEGTHRRLAQLSATQRAILKLLDLPDTALKTFKRRCGT